VSNQKSSHRLREGRGVNGEDAWTEPIADSDLWQYFLKERDEILRHEWIESKNAGYDIGMDRAIRDRLKKHHALWAAAQDAPSAQQE
jgi:hypothetical protein